jgi:hypothetical protein
MCEQLSDATCLRDPIIKRTKHLSDLTLLIDRRKR